jgi:hypothetical protein
MLLSAPPSAGKISRASLFIVRSCRKNGAQVCSVLLRCACRTFAQTIQEGLEIDLWHHAVPPACIQQSERFFLLSRVERCERFFVLSCAAPLSMRPDAAFVASEGVFPDGFSEVKGFFCLYREDSESLSTGNLSAERKRTSFITVN